MSQDPISELEKQIEFLEARLALLERLHGEELAAESGPVSAAPEQARPEPPRPQVPTTAPEAVPPTPLVPPPPRRTRADTRLEEEIGGNWLNKIGAVALVLAVAFFLKYAFDNRWIDETGRIIIGTLIGLGSIFGGEYFQKRQFPKYAQGLSGAGIAVLYFTMYAAYGFYRVIDPLTAFGFMAVVTIAAIALSVRYDAVVIAVLGIIGGFLTPALLRTAGGGGDSQAQLFTYIIILDLGILGVTYYKGWRELNLLSLAGTALVFSGWAVDNYSPDKLGVTMFFLTVFYAIFAAQAFVQNVVARRKLNAADAFLAIAPPILYFAASFSLLSHDYYVAMGVFAVAMAALYVLLARRVHAMGFEDKGLGLIFLSIAAGFLIIAIPIQLRTYWITIGWAGEAAALVLVGFYVKSCKTRLVALGLLALAAFRLLFFDTPMYTYTGQLIMPFYNARFGTFLFTIAMAALIAWLYHRQRDEAESGEGVVLPLLILGANFLMIWALSAEVLAAVYDGTMSTETLALSVVWTVYAVALILAGIGWKHLPVRLMGIVLLGVVIVKTFLFDVWTLERLHRILAFAVLAVMLLAASYFYQRYKDRIRQFVTGEEGEHEQS